MSFGKWLSNIVITIFVMLIGSMCMWLKNCHFKFAGLVYSEAIRKLYGFLWQSQSGKLRYELGQEDFARDVV